MPIDLLHETNIVVMKFYEVTNLPLVQEPEHSYTSHKKQDNMQILSHDDEILEQTHELHNKMSMFNHVQMIEHDHHKYH